MSEDDRPTPNSDARPAPQPAPPMRARFAQAVEETIAAYDQHAGEYAERRADMRPHWAERMEQVVDLLREAETRHPLPDYGRPGDDCTLDEYLMLVPVLDAGCGPGRDARALAAYDLPVLGADLSQGMLDAAGERTPRRLRTGSIRYALMDLRRLELPDAACRGVWCSASLLHLPKRAAPRAVSELARVSRRGAPFAIFVKEREGEVEEEMTAYVDGRRFYAYYLEDELRALVTSVGLEVLDLAHVPDERADNPGWLSLLARKPDA